MVERCTANREGTGNGSSKKRILAVASGGGHWQQLLLCAGAWAEQDVAFVTVRGADRGAAGRRCYTVANATRWNPLGLMLLALQMIWLVIRERPQIVITTGAAPGYFALLWGRLAGARTVWIDSIANTEQLSMAGAWAGRWADLWLTQWPHLARPGGPHYGGAVL